MMEEHEEVEILDNAHYILSRGEPFVCCSVCDAPMRLVDCCMHLTDMVIMRYACEKECPVKQVDYFVEVMNDDEE